jgi:hypothetical protein
MKIKIIALLLLVIISIGCQEKKPCKRDFRAEKMIVRLADSTDSTNDFFDNSHTFPLFTNDIVVQGEVSNPGKVDFSQLTLHSLVCKEVRLESGELQFAGAFRYYGYSLSEILNHFHIQKKNAKDFHPLTDLYVEIENQNGSKVLISWGEIYYTNTLNDIIIATQVMPITPSRTKQSWKLPLHSKLVVGHDHLTERNISQPRRITLKSFPIHLKVIKGKNPLYSPRLSLYVQDSLYEVFSQNPTHFTEEKMDIIYYGRGLGLHSMHPYTGIDFKNLIQEKVAKTPLNIRHGLVVVAGDDGYRAVFSYSEICNRTDQKKLLLVCKPEVKNRGIFSVYPGFDFFSDRAVTGIRSVYCRR